MRLSDTLLIDKLEKFSKENPSLILFRDLKNNRGYTAGMLLVELEHQTQVGKDFLEIVLNIMDKFNTKMEEKKE